MKRQDDPNPFGPGVVTGKAQFVVELLHGGEGNGRRLYLGHPTPPYRPPARDLEEMKARAIERWPRLPVDSPDLAAKRITPAEAHDLARAEGLGPDDYRLVPVPIPPPVMAPSTQEAP